MTPPNKTIRWQTLSGTPITIGDTTLTPQSQSFTLRWSHGGLVWNRPVAILVQRNYWLEHIPIVDMTRRVQLGLLVFSLVFAVVTLILSARYARRLK